MPEEAAERAQVLNGFYLASADASLRNGNLHSRPEEAGRVLIYVNGKIVARKANNTTMEILSFASREGLV